MKRFIKDFKKYIKYAIYLAKAELKSEVANSYLNWVWWVLEPLCMMFIYVIVFQYIFGTKKEFFPIFIYIGLTAWNFFQRDVVTSVRLMYNNKSVISKVYIPKFMLVTSKMMVNFFKMMISFLLVVGMMIIYKVPVTWRVVEVVPLLVLLWIFTYAVSTIVLHLGVFIEDMQYVTTIVLRLIFYLTGIFYDIVQKLEKMEYHGHTFAIIMSKWNPMAYIIIQMRNCLIYKTGVEWKYYFIWLGISLLLAVLGTSIIYKNENSYIKVL